MQSWNVAAAVFAYGFGTLAELGYAYVGADQLIGGPWPDNNPEVSCLDWTTGEPNAKYWAIHLLASTLGGKDEKTIHAYNETANGTLTSKAWNSSLPKQPVYALPYTRNGGEKGVLLINKKQTPQSVTIAGIEGGNALVVEVALEGPDAAEPGFASPLAKEISEDGVLVLGPFAVAVVTELREGKGGVRIKTDDGAAPKPHVVIAIGGKLPLLSLELIQLLGAFEYNRSSADDYGWNNIGYHGNKEVHTPTLDRLARGGLILDRHYVFK